MRKQLAMSAALDASIAELSDEIRRYPGPIARCDEQLTDLLERRALLLREKARGKPGDRPRFSVPLDEPALGCEKKKTWSVPGFPRGCTPENVWINDGGFNAA